MISIAEEMNPTRRNTMEDVHAYHAPSTWNCPDDNATFIGVYDGHGGRNIVDYLEDHLADNVAKEWCFETREKENGDGRDQTTKKRRLENGSSDENVGINTDNPENDEGLTIRTCLERAFLLTDIKSRMAGIQTSGSTVACCIVVPKLSASGTLASISVHCANAGDARIVLSSSAARRCGSKNDADANQSPKRSSSAVRLTHDHKATDPKEISRIQSSGGVMIRGRVLGVLAVARSLGDHGLKDFVIARPYLSSTLVSIEGTTNSIAGWDKKSPLTDGEFLIVACDGLWDVMEDQEAVDLARKFVGGDERKRDEAARYLVDEALRRGSTDNITVIVYWL